MARTLPIPVLLAAAMAFAAGGAAAGQKGRQKEQPPRSEFRTDVPEHVGSAIVGRPTGTSVTASLLLRSAAEGVLVWGTDAKALPPEGRPVALKAGELVAVMLDGLAPNTRYFYELRDAATRKRLLPATGPGTFHTQRARGSAFTFTLTADSHLDGNTSPEVYLRTLANALADAPDFHLDLGDTFMTDKHESRESAFKQYLAQRYYFGSLCHSTPLFLVLGNHDGEGTSGRGRDADGLAVWSHQMRTRFFPNPVPDAFFTGNVTRHAEAGLLQDYYGWEWGDALFVVLDPYWFEERQRGQRDNWQLTLGAEQYQWLQRTLESSKASAKFIFTHHLVGGLSSQGRGGAEAAPLFEWGGKNPDGTNGFGARRPGWAMPVHALLVRNHATIVFHGHDHLYAKQDIDGIVYQEVPQPGDPKASSRGAADYGYTNGVILNGAGHLRVTVRASQVSVDYVRADKSLAHSYTIPVKR